MRCSSAGAAAGLLPRRTSYLRCSSVWITTSREKRGSRLTTAPLAGRGEPGTQGETLAFEQQQLAGAADLLGLLERERVDAARRAMLVVPKDLQWSWWDDVTLELQFWLPAGSFATSVVRELLSNGAAAPLGDE